MALFGKKQKHGEKKQKPQPKNKKRATKRKFKRPSDVKLFYIMPVMVVIGATCIGAGIGWTKHNNDVYQAHLMASSMKYQEELPLWGGSSKGTLQLGHTKLSKDGKTLAVEITYDDTAHQELSSFGDRYKLRLVDTDDNRMKDAKLSYGLFGTDGSGILTVTNPKGFKNKSFIVMIIDNGKLVTTDELNDSSTQLSDSELDKSITAELSNPSSQSSDENNQQDETKRKNLPPLYYVRLNARSASRNYRNWKTDNEIVEDLFINSNLDDLKDKMENLQNKITKAEKTLDEMKERLRRNKQDNTAIENKQNLQQSIASMKRQYKEAQKRYDKLDNAKIKANILAPKQTHYHAYTVPDINEIK